MRDWVSTRWVRVSGLLAAIGLVCVVVPAAVPWLVAAWASLILGTVALLRGRDARSLRELIDAGESQGRLVAVVARPRQRVAPRPL